MTRAPGQPSLYETSILVQNTDNVARPAAARPYWTRARLPGDRARGEVAALIERAWQAAQAPA